MFAFARFSSLSSLVSAAFASLALTTVAGCGSSAGNTGDANANGATAVEQATSGTTGASSFCNAYCSKMSSCDSTVDQDTCAIQCENSSGATLGRTNPTVAQNLTACVQKADCATALQTNVVASCDDEAIADVSPSAAAQSFCTAFAATNSNCDGDVEVGACLDAAKAYSDAILEQATSCTSKTCSTMTDCISAVLGVSETSSGADAGT